jgi:glycosyltransferase involved in cell wall biosynthesis
MRILHVGFGIRELRGGGLIEYAEDLMQAQAEHGDEIGYFFSGRQYPLLKRSLLRKWKRGPIRLFEVINSPIFHGGDRGTADPAMDLSEPRVEALFQRVLSSFRPEVIHIHELASLPSSLITIIRAAGVPFLMTLQDYALLCPTLKLLDYSGAICLKQDVGEICVQCCKGAKKNAQVRVGDSLYYDMTRFKDRLPPIIGNALKKPGMLALEWLSGRSRQNPNPAVTEPANSKGELYQHRRDLNVERLNQVDLLIAMSHRLEQIYRQLGVDERRIRTVHLTVNHLNALHPKSQSVPPSPVNFGTLNGCISAPKGAHLIMGALRILKGMGLTDQFRLLVWGGMLSSIREELLAQPNVVVRGWYKVPDLDGMLDKVDVGIIPSTWEEAYGYVGLEYLSKGIPIIGNAMGGIPDYTKDGLTGWVNHSNSAEGLAEIMAGIIRNPSQITMLNEYIIAHRPELVKTMNVHRGEINTLYLEAMDRCTENSVR